jgi:hypothetical protein
MFFFGNYGVSGRVIIGPNSDLPNEEHNQQWWYRVPQEIEAASEQAVEASNFKVGWSLVLFGPLPYSSTSAWIWSCDPSEAASSDWLWSFGHTCTLSLMWGLLAEVINILSVREIIATRNSFSHKPSAKASFFVNATCWLRCQCTYWQM